MIEGYGIHTGQVCTVHIHVEPGPLRLRRGGTDIPVRVESVVATRSSTTLGADSARVGTVEHLLAALHVRGWWRDLVIEASADELPILDGSSSPWLPVIDALGAPPPAPAPLVVEQAFSYGDGDASLHVQPGDTSLTITVAYPHPAIGEQRWWGTPDSYAGLLEARTFGFLDDLEKLREAGLARHASLENVIVFAREGPLTPLRSSDEVVRHKALDALGDLFLLGRPLRGRLEIARGSHQSHVAFVRALALSFPQETPIA